MVKRTPRRSLSIQDIHTNIGIVLKSQVSKSVYDFGEAKYPIVLKYERAPSPQDKA
mgnify:CR=1 FL=1